MTFEIKKYPPAISNFLVAEAVRNEAGGKVTIIGAYADGRILVQPSAALPLAFPLALYAVFSQGEGEFAVRVAITDPQGRDFEANIGPAVKDPRKALTLMLNYPAFVVEKLGEYKVRIFLDDHTYLAAFSIVAQDF